MTEAFLYDAKGHDSAIELSAIDVEALGDRQLLWIDASSDDAPLDVLAQLLGPDGITAPTPHAARDIPRIERYEKHFHFSVPLPPGEHNTRPKLDFFVGKSWLVTLRDQPVAFFSTFREEDRGESLNGRLTPAALMASLLDRHFDAFQAEITSVQKAIDAIDSDILGPGKSRPPLAKLARMRQRVANLRIAIDEHRRVVHGFLRPDFKAVIGTPDQPFFEALERHFDRTEDAIDVAREAVVGSFELYATRTAQETNELLKVLTITTVIIGAASALAGIFGMNFKTRLGDSGDTGFFVTVAVMILVAVGVMVIARWRRWV